MSHFPCPYLGGVVELSAEREIHITERHPDLLPQYRERLAEALLDPEQVRKSARFGNARLFSRWYTDAKSGKHVVVVVVSDSDASNRHWVVTAYVARKLAEGEVEWNRG